MAVGVLLDVEELRAGERLDCVERMQERAPAEEERARRLQLCVQPREQADTAPGHVGVEGGAILRDVRPDEPREALPDRRRLGVVADKQCCHEWPGAPFTLVVRSDDLITYRRGQTVHPNRSRPLCST